MARVVWSAVACDDLKAVVDYIKADSPGYAKTFGWHIRQRVGQLQHFPESGRRVWRALLSVLLWFWQCRHSHPSLFDN
jgi:plasmid stabilization system protein ParE